MSIPDRKTILRIAACIQIRFQNSAYRMVHGHCHRGTGNHIPAVAQRSLSKQLSRHNHYQKHQWVDISFVKNNKAIRVITNGFNKNDL